MSEKWLEREFSLEELPFSRFGSYFVIDLIEENERKSLYLRDIRGGDLQSGCQFLITFYNSGKQVPLTQLKIHRSATEIEFSYKKNAHFKTRLCMPEPEMLMVKGEGLDLKLTYVHRRYDSIYPLLDGSYELVSYSKEIKYRLRNLSGQFNLKAPWERIGSKEISLSFTEDYVFTLSSYKVVENEGGGQMTDYETGLKAVQADYTNWVEGFLNGPEGRHLCALKGTRGAHLEEALLILWMNIVAPEGRLKRPAMYMNKHFMTNIWSWDNYFGAIALAVSHPDLAWDQLMFFSDHQHRTGAYPDYVNDQYASFSCLKPPIAYFAYEQMTRLNPEYFEANERLVSFYETAKHNTEFWLNHRMTRYGLPAYYHGNDSGWDNGTFFQEGVPVITPDLAAFLIYQLDGLEMLAVKLGRSDQARQFHLQSEVLLERLIHLLWREEDKRFSAIYVTTNSYITSGDTLQAFLPLLIAHKLPLAIQKYLIEGLNDEKRFLSPFGLATESKLSPHYAYNGYWRGPIWAPTTYLMIAALKGCGDFELAESIRLKWLHLVEKSGFYENFDPVTGEGLVDPSFAWTASVYLSLLKP